MDRSAETAWLPYCQNSSATLLAYSILNQGNIYFDEEEENLLKSIALKYEKTPSQIILNWIVSKSGVVAIIKTSRINHLQENIEATQFELDINDKERIESIGKNYYQDVPITSIYVQNILNKPVYSTLQEAIENKFDLIPSPSNLATMIKDGSYFKPIRLKKISEVKNNFEYILDDYDYLDQLKKYWAWQIAYG